MKKLVSLLAVGSMALALSACGGNSETTTTNTIETNVEEIGTVNEAENLATPEPSPSPSVTPAPASTGKEFDSTTTQDDADATGMTSRVNRDDGNDSQPAH
ncbi:hypothetical protein OF829_13505 [Sphingomonas sp. LB-2]|uniref:hypothetical protein n=1 Tax=Sphingomonas caeni TaxID=2984949 RepID=UPI002230B5F8|nr:hypothetical protein [Sphingomonas caeni]MCW3848257.1 hypothetical protein [Sphingomonas caeni]